ncbi:MAG: N-acetylmuramoyl-L-alanine amidase [Clostridium sp.]|nr:N-acetylmuramoyl-L-alanine amidase [Clostridium sp.]
MKIAVRGGHNFQSTGASALIDETIEDRKVKDSIIKYLSLLGHEVLDVTPGNMDTDNDLVFGVSKANNWGADLFISDHFNKAFNSYDGALGTEVWVYSKGDNITSDEEVGTRIVNAIAELGFKNRGVKESKELYELKATKMASIIVETCFVEATEDVALYRKLGPDKIGQVIAEAISNKKINNVVEERKYDMKNLVVYGNIVDKRAAEYLADYLNCPCFDGNMKFDYSKIENVYCVGGEPSVKWTGYAKKIIAGSNRYETVKEVLKYIGKL